MTHGLGVLMIGLNGSVATTLTAGACALRRGLSDDDCMVTETPPFQDLNLRPITALVFGGWDLQREIRHSDAARRFAEAPSALIEAVSADLDSIEVQRGVSLGISDAVRAAARIREDSDPTRADAARRIQSEITSFVKDRSLEGAIVVNLASTEPPAPPCRAHNSLADFEAALAVDSPDITAGMVYAYAALQAGCPVLNYTPSDVFEIPALVELAELRSLPLAGRDGKTGQTFYKTVLAPALRARALRIEGWYSTNILGNGDGLTLSNSANLAGKRRSKVDSVSTLLGEGVDHQVHINHYAPRKKQKEAWDSIDMRGWLGAPIQMRVNWIAPDSALAAPMVLDVVRLLWWAKQNNRAGVQGFLGAFFKDPLGCDAQGFSQQFDLLISTADSA